MMNKRAKLKIVRFLICALLLCSFPSVKAFADDTFVSYCTTIFYFDGVLDSDQTDYEESIWFDGSSNYCYITTPYGFGFSGISISPSVGFTYSFADNGSDILVYFGSSFNSSYSYTISLYFETVGPIPTATPTPSPTATPTPWVNKYYGSGNITSYLYFFNGSYPSNSDNNTWFDPSNQIFSKIIIRVADHSSFTGDIELPFPYILNKSRYPVLVNRAAEGYNNKGYSGTFSVGNDDGTILHVNSLARNGYSGDSCDVFISVITVTPTPSLSPTPTLTPYPSSAPAALSTYTISFVAPNGYVVGTVRPMLSVGSSYSGAISSLAFSFLDGWFSYGDEVNGQKGSFIWDYRLVENFGDYQWFFSTDSWPQSESINIPVYRLDGEYPEVVPDLNNVSDLFDTIGKTDPKNFSWFYDGLQSFIDINWSWAYLMLLFPLFVMLWAFFRRH